jgi:hypothetical protein
MLEDETAFINFGFPEEKYFYPFSLDQFKPSMMAKYPDNYKFTGIDLYASHGSFVNQRYAYDIFNWFGDVGGVKEFFSLALTLLTYQFANVTSAANLTKALYL